MKILVISAAFPPMKVGEAEHALHLCHRLNQRGFDVHVLTTKRETTTDAPFKVHAIMPHWLWRDLPRLASFLRHCSPDAVLLIYSDRDYNCHPMITYAPSISKALLPSVPFVTQFETEHVSRQVSIPARAILKLLSRSAARWIDYLFGTLLSQSERIIVLSDRHLAEFASRFHNIEKKAVVIPPPPLLRISPGDAASKQRVRGMLGVKPDEFVIAHYGYVYAEKGIETLFKAFEILNAQRSNIRLWMVGGTRGVDHNSSYVDGIHQLARSLGIHTKVNWTGEYSSDNDEASLYLRSADACVFPFKYGVTLNRSSLAAAAAHGLPIVTTKGKVLEAPFLDEQNMLLCPPDDPTSLALTMASLMDNPALCQRLRMGAFKLANEYFSWDRALDRTIEALGQ